MEKSLNYKLTKNDFRSKIQPVFQGFQETLKALKIEPNNEIKFSNFNILENFFYFIFITHFNDFSDPSFYKNKDKDDLLSFLGILNAIKSMELFKQRNELTPDDKKEIKQALNNFKMNEIYLKGSNDFKKSLAFLFSLVIFLDSKALYDFFIYYFKWQEFILKPKEKQEGKKLNDLLKTLNV